MSAAAVGIGDKLPLEITGVEASQPWGKCAVSGAIEVPVFTVLGYFDDFSSGTARLIEATGAEAVCGPWVP